MNIVDQIQENMLAYFRLFVGLPGIISCDEDLFWLITSRAEPGNYILRTQFSQAHVEQRIDQTLKHIGQHTQHLDWMVFPGCQPAKLGQHLEARAMRSGPGGNWMLLELDQLSTHYTIPEHFRIEHVQNMAMLTNWRDISAAGFGSDIQVHYEAYVQHGFTKQAYSLHYIGYAGNQPVTSGTLLLAGGIAGIWDVSTPPALRGHGYASAITYSMLAIAHRLGYQQAWVWSSHMGCDVYRKLGFVLSDFGIREYTWEGSSHPIDKAEAPQTDF